MVRIIRFMSAREALRILNGEIVHNETNHAEAGQSSKAIGFCFLPVKPNDTIYQHAQYLSGITDMDVCLDAVLPDNHGLLVTKARYRDPNGGQQWVKELSTTAYGLDDFEEWEMYTPEKTRDMFGIAFPATSINWSTMPYPLNLPAAAGKRNYNADNS